MPRPRVDHRTDIYAFGIVAYELLTGQMPFDGEDYMDILLSQISDEKAAPPSTHAPHLPKERRPTPASPGCCARIRPSDRPTW